MWCGGSSRRREPQQPQELRLAPPALGRGSASAPPYIILHVRGRVIASPPGGGRRSARPPARHRPRLQGQTVIRSSCQISHPHTAPPPPPPHQPTATPKPEPTIFSNPLSRHPPPSPLTHTLAQPARRTGEPKCRADRRALRMKHGPRFVRDRGACCSSEFALHSSPARSAPRNAGERKRTGASTTEEKQQ